MVQSISKVAGFRGPAEAKPVPPTPQRSFVRGGPSSLASAPAPHSTSVRASQDAEAKKIQTLFMEMNPGRAHSIHSAQFMLNGKPATIDGTKDELTVRSEDFEMKIDHGELAGVTGIPGDLMRYRKLLEIDDALQQHLGMPGVWKKPGKAAGS